MDIWYVLMQQTSNEACKIQSKKQSTGKTV